MAGDGKSPEERQRAEFLRRGWIRFPHDPQVEAWVSAVEREAEACARDRDFRSRWLRCDGTWFAGVNALGNAPDGSIASAGVPALEGAPLRFVRAYAGEVALDRAQISIVYPGYPRKGEEEGDSAFRYRVRRHAAHVDGFERTMPGRRRRLSELHAFVLGIPLTRAGETSSPLSVWEGSQEVVRSVFREAFHGVPTKNWTEMDSTDAYGSARSECFRSCARISISAKPGEAYVVHRLALHGISPWQGREDGSPRVVAYFRPAMTGDNLPERWLLDA